MVSELESDVLGLVFEYYLPLFSGETIKLSTIFCHIMHAVRAECQRKTSQIKLIAQREPRANFICQELWETLFDPNEMSPKILCSLCQPRPRRETDSEELVELFTNCLHKIIKIMGAAMLSGQEITVGDQDVGLIQFDKNIHKCVSHAVNQGSECSVLFPLLTCKGIVLTQALVIQIDGNDFTNETESI